MPKIIKRNAEFEVEILSNGFILKIGGRNDEEGWSTVKTFYSNLTDLMAAAEEYVALPED